MRQQKADAKKETSTQATEISAASAIQACTRENKQCVIGTASASAYANYRTADSLIGWHSSHHTKHLGHE